MKILNAFLLITLFFSCSSGGSGDDDGNPVTICTLPADTSTSSISVESATIIWSVVTDAINYEIEFGEFGFNQGQGQTIITSSNSRTITNLLSETDY